MNTPGGKHSHCPSAVRVASQRRKEGREREDEEERGRGKLGRTTRPPGGLKAATLDSKPGEGEEEGEGECHHTRKLWLINPLVRSLRTCARTYPHGYKPNSSSAQTLSTARRAPACP